MRDSNFDVVVIGAGQSGLAAGYYLQQTQLRFVILEKGEAPAGSWQNYYNSLRLFSPVAYSSLPGYTFPYSPNYYPKRDEVSAYLHAYAQHFQLPVFTNVEVSQVNKQANGFVIETKDKTFYAKAVIAATGAFHQPYWPQLPNQACYEGTLLHASSYKSPEPFANQRIVVVGGGNSAIQIAAELSEVGRVTVASRRRLRFFPQTLLGYDVHVWLQKTGVDYLPVSEKENRPIIDSGGFRAALREGVFDKRPLFKQFTTNGVVWNDDTEELIDTVILATGYRPNLDYLKLPDILKANHFPRQKRGVAQTISGLYFVGLPGQRNGASATLRGSGDDAKYVVKHLQGYLARQYAQSSRANNWPQKLCQRYLVCCQ